MIALKEIKTYKKLYFGCTFSSYENGLTLTLATSSLVCHATYTQDGCIKLGEWCFSQLSLVPMYRPPDPGGHGYFSESLDSHQVFSLRQITFAFKAPFLEAVRGQRKHAVWHQDFDNPPDHHYLIKMLLFKSKNLFNVMPLWLVAGLKPFVIRE